MEYYTAVKDEESLLNNPHYILLSGKRVVSVIHYDLLIIGDKCR